MAELQYAFVKNGEVVNMVVFDDPSEELLEQFKELHQVEEIIEATSTAVVGGTYEDSVFWTPKPYPSWTKNLEEEVWEAPVPMPTDDLPYKWDEATLSWVVVTE